MSASVPVKYDIQIQSIALHLFY